ncbi:MAG: FAD-dependent monooxygenase [Motiliproteus sp.]|nr:FAD-dependent monooxygenase [Motiliproteus sp.]MCW9053437.1 FAD-dependent monooxygenase [Motiliproteus sp.]
MSESSQYDLIIVGGGMVGATLACALGNSDLKIAVIDQQAPQPFSADQPHDLRVSALSVASQRILENVGAWGGIATRRSCPYRRMRVWETESQGDTLFESGDIDEPVLGHIVENRITQLALWESMSQFDNVTLYCPARIQSIDYQAGCSQVALENGESLTGKLLVGADGGQSRVRQAAGIGIHSWEYKQHALVAYVETEYPQQDITWQKFVPSGPLAFLPLTGNYGSLVWYNTPSEVKRLLALKDENFSQELFAEFPRELGELNRIISRASFPLRRQHALEYVKQGVALVGDAAHMIHPLAGQGVNIGLLDAAALAEVLAEAAREHQDVASLSVLTKFQQQRRKHNLAMMTTMDLFYRVFGDDKLPTKLIRNLGLGLAQRLTPAKNKAMRFAMGLEGPLPQLAKR